MILNLAVLVLLIPETFLLALECFHAVLGLTRNVYHSLTSSQSEIKKYNFKIV